MDFIYTVLIFFEGKLSAIKEERPFGLLATVICTNRF